MTLQAYALLDIESNTTAIVPFEFVHRIVRRVRLQHNLLIIEWAEKEPYHNLNDHEQVHRHFATAFDVVPIEGCFPWLSRWNVTYRSEWKLHYLGFPLNQRDVWFSTHSSTYYAIYIWQPNRSAWGEDEPIESFFIWNISQPSTPDHPLGNGQPRTGPHVVQKLCYRDLDHLTLRQRDTPFLRRIELDGDGCVYFFEEGCSGERGLHVGHQRGIIEEYWERVVGIPIVGYGPRWEDRCDNNSDLAAASATSTENGSPKRATCWRYSGVYPTIRSQAFQDEPAGIGTYIPELICPSQYSDLIRKTHCGSKQRVVTS